MAEKKTVFIRGKAFYPKIFNAVPNYNKDGFEWTIDLALDSAGVAQATSEISKKKLKENDNFGTYIRFKQSTTYKDPVSGEMKTRKGPEVVDAAGKPWNPDIKIGNESLVDVKAQVVDYGAGKELGVYLQKVRVLELVPYEGGQDFPELTGEDEKFKVAAQAERPAVRQETVGDIIEGNQDDLDDEIPV
jgi:hypothetical protein